MVVVSTDKIAQQIMLVKHLVVRNFLGVTEELHIKIRKMEVNYWWDGAVDPCFNIGPGGGGGGGYLEVVEVEVTV